MPLAGYTGGLTLSTSGGTIRGYGDYAVSATVVRSSSAVLLGTRGQEAAHFANAVYGRAFDDKSPSRGGLLAAIGVSYNPTKGFQAAMFRGANGQYYLAFRGTEGIFDRQDQGANKQQAYGHRTEQYQEAIKLSREVQSAVDRFGGKLILVGHSLGGGLAIASAHANGLDAEVFNPAWVNSPYIDGIPGKIRSHVVRGDPLDIARRWIGADSSGEVIYHERKWGRGWAHNMGHFLE